MFKKETIPFLTARMIIQCKYIFGCIFSRNDDSGDRKILHCQNVMITKLRIIAKHRQLKNRDICLAT